MHFSILRIRMDISRYKQEGSCLALVAAAGFRAHLGKYGKGKGGEEGRVDVVCAMRRKFDGREGAVGL